MVQCSGREEMNIEGDQTVQCSKMQQSNQHFASQHAPEISVNALVRNNPDYTKKSQGDTQNAVEKADPRLSKAIQDCVQSSIQIEKGTDKSQSPDEQAGVGAVKEKPA